jgi:hypothetical protein
MFSGGWLIAYLFAALWLWGWVAMAHSVSLEHSDRIWRKVGSYAIVFFIWPYIAFCQASQGDI